MNVLVQRGVIEMFESLKWESDWSGDEVGFNDVDIVGLWTLILTDGRMVHMNIDYSTNTILDSWLNEEVE